MKSILRRRLLNPHAFSQNHDASRETHRMRGEIHRTFFIVTHSVTGRAYHSANSHDWIKQSFSFGRYESGKKINGVNNGTHSFKEKPRA